MRGVPELASRFLLLCPDLEGLGRGKRVLFSRLGMQPRPLDAGAERAGGPGRGAASPRKGYRRPAGEGVAAAAQGQTCRAFTWPPWKFRFWRESRWCCRARLVETVVNGPGVRGSAWPALTWCCARRDRGIGPACPQVLIVVSQESWGEQGGGWKEASGLGFGGSRRWRRAGFLPVFEVREGLSEEVTVRPGEDLGQVWVLSHRR